MHMSHVSVCYCAVYAHAPAGREGGVLITRVEILKSSDVVLICMRTFTDRKSVEETPVSAWRNINHVDIVNREQYR